MNIYKYMLMLLPNIIYSHDPKSGRKKASISTDPFHFPVVCGILALEIISVELIDTQRPLYSSVAFSKWW